MANFIIKTAESELKKDKNTKSYKTVTFTEIGFMETPWGRIQKPVAQCVSTAINCYEENYLGRMDLGWNDPIFNSKNPTAGGIFQGSIETRNVVPYDILNPSTGEVRKVDTYKTIVFGDTDSPAFESAVKSTFKSRGQIVTSSPQVNFNIGINQESLVDA